MAFRSAPFIFAHSSIGLKSFGPGRAAAAANYATNAKKNPRVFTVNLPAQNRHALKDHINRYEEALPRKDSRVAEMFVIGLPLRMNAVQRAQAAVRFIWRMTKGRSRAWAALHENDPGNPHMHVGYLDRDIETGKPVRMMTGTPRARMAAGLEATGTEFARRAWEEAANSVAEEHGLEWRIDRRSYADQGVDKTPQQHRGWQTIPEMEFVGAPPAEVSEPVQPQGLPAGIESLPEVHPIAPTAGVEAIAESTQESPAPLESAMDHEQHLDAVAEAVHRGLKAEQVQQDGDKPRLVEPWQGGRTADFVLRIKQNHRELNELRGNRQRLSQLENDLSTAETNARLRRLDATDAQTAAANAGMEADDFRQQNASWHRDGKPIGLALPESRWLGPLSGWKSTRRLMSEDKIRSIESGYQFAEQKQQAAADMDFDAARAETQRDNLTASRNALALQLRQYGTEEELADSERLYEEHISQDVSELSLSELKEALNHPDELERLDIETYREMLYLKGEHELLQEFDESRGAEL